jgi:hypothetical protein
VHAEALAVLVAITADFVLNRWNLEILLYYRIRTYHGASIMRTAFDWKRSRISMLDVDHVKMDGRE